MSLSCLLGDMNRALHAVTLRIFLQSSYRSTIGLSVKTRYFQPCALCRMLGNLEYSTLLQKVEASSFSFSGIFVQLLVAISIMNYPMDRLKQATLGFYVFLLLGSLQLRLSSLPEVFVIFQSSSVIYSMLNAYSFQQSSSQLFLMYTAEQSNSSQFFILSVRQSSSWVSISTNRFFFADSKSTTNYSWCRI